MRRLLIIAALVCAGGLTSALVLALSAPDPALLVNGDFESGQEPWAVNLGGTFTIVDDPVESDHAATITLTLSSAALVQKVTLQPGYSYRVTGSFLAALGSIQQVKPEVQAFDTTGNSFNLFSTVPLLLPGSWSFDLILPCDASPEANMRVWVTGSPSAIAYLDDLGLKSVAPKTPCPTVTPTPSDTPTTAPTDTPSPTPTRTPTSTRTPTRTRTPTNTPAQQPTDAPPPQEPTSATPTPTLTPSNGLLINGGFEAADGGAPAAWRHFGGALEHTSAYVRSGDRAARLTSATTSTKWAYQAVAIDPDAWYQFDAYVFADDPAVDATWLRISWYASADASGSALATSDSIKTLDAPEAAFRLLSTGSVQAPADAHSASVRVLLRPVSAAVASIFVDDASFVVAEPATPTPSATTEPTSTPTPPIPTATPTVTRTPSPTRTPTMTRTPTAVASPDDGSTTTPASEATSAEQTPTQRPRATPTRQPATAVVLPPTPSNGLLLNGGFEAMDSDKLIGWETYGGEVAQTDAPVQAGSYAGKFASDTESTKWLYQPVSIDPGAWYTFSAYVYANDSEVEDALLRVSWYASADASGSAISSSDSTELLSDPLDGFRQLTTASVQAPVDAHSAKARVVLRPRGRAVATVFVDDAWFVASDPAPPEAEVPEAAASDVGDPDGAISVARSTSRGSSSPSAQVAGVQRPPDLAPQPSPVISRGSRDALAAPDPSDGGSGIAGWWRLAAPIGVAAALGGAGWGAWWRDRQRRTALSAPS